MNEHPLKGYRFSVYLEGVPFSGFKSVDGLEGKVKTFTYNELGRNLSEVTLPDRVKWSPIILKRGYATSDLWEWFAMRMFLETSHGTFPKPFFRRNLSVVLFNADGSVEKRWHVYGAWVSKYKLGELDATADGVLLEEVEVRHNGFELDLGGLTV